MGDIVSHGNTFWPFQINSVHPYAYWSNAFSDEECKKIIKIGLKNLEKASIIGSSADLRKSDISWIFPEDDTSWIFNRLSAIIMSLNDQFFKFNLLGFAEGLQFTKYTEPDSSYGSHVDIAFNYSVRKLSISVQLSVEKSYTGGDLLLHIEKNPVQAPKQQGTLIAFPSYTLHEVTPITKGNRYSLVAWVTGEPFK
jgi:PKHD-type hydroxylase